MWGRTSWKQESRAELFHQKQVASSQMDEKEQVQNLSQPVAHTIRTSDSSRTLELKGWSISTAKLPISNSREIDDMSSSLTIPIPEMIFGNNVIRIKHQDSDIDLFWTAHDALDRVDKNGTELKVKYSADWHKSRSDHDEIKQVTKPYDWTYSTDYAGSSASGSGHTWEATDELLPLELLKRQDPILFYDEVILYESELDDNGISLFTVRVRVMPERLLILARFFMRLDEVIFRVRDTRLYIEFETRLILREYLERERPYEDLWKIVQSSNKKDEAGAVLSDVNWVTERCPIIDGKLEKLVNR